jgi:stage V sporulation protein G
MNITEIRVKLVPNDAERLKAFCSITLDSDFVVRDLKVIDGSNGLFVAMPSRKLSDRCPRCGSKNHLRARYCNECGTQLGETRASRDDMGRAKLHADIAHPINAACREKLQQAVIEAYQDEFNRSQQPGYQPAAYDNEYADLDTNDNIEPDQEQAQEPSDEEAEGQNDDFTSLIAGLNRDAQSRRDDRRRREQGPRRGGPDRPPSPEQRAGAAKAATGKRGSALDDFLSKLGGAGGGPHKRRGGRRGQGGPRKDKPQGQPSPGAGQSPPPPAEPEPEPQPVPAAPAQPPQEEPRPDDDDFGAGIL